MDKDERIQRVFDKYRDMTPSSVTDKQRIMERYEQDLIRAGMTEDEAELEVFGWGEITWAKEDWMDWYGASDDEELESAQDSDAWWDED